MPIEYRVDPGPMSTNPRERPLSITPVVWLVSPRCLVCGRAFPLHRFRLTMLAPCFRPALTPVARGQRLGIPGEFQCAETILR